MIDIGVISIGLVGFISFLLLQPIIRKIFSETEDVSLLLALQGIIGIIVIFSAATFAYSMKQSFFYSCVMVLFAEGIFQGLALIYMATVISYLESSITLRIFWLIGVHPHRGITRTELESIYSRDVLVQRRLRRFERMGIIVKDKKGNYVYQKSFNIFAMRGMFTSLLDILFPSWH